MNFNKPIPGQSLTVEPRKYPYERPPEINDPEEAIQMHLQRLNNEEMMQHIVDLIEIDPEEMDIVTITNGILRGAVAEGIHSIDTSIIIAPVIHEFIKQVAEINGIEYEEGLENKKEKAEGRKKIQQAKAERIVDEALKVGKEPSPEQAEVVEEPLEEEMPQAKGFFKSRRNK